MCCECADNRRVSLPQAPCDPPPEFDSSTPAEAPELGQAPQAAQALRRVAHLDMDAFFASVELLRYPQLKGLPVVIGGRGRDQNPALVEAAANGTQADVPLQAFSRLADYVGRGVITTATYAARPFGVGSAMGMMKAARLCPQAILLPANFDDYKRYSRAFKQVITDIAPVMEDRGIDEVYIDFTDVPGGQRDGGRALAKLIQTHIFQATGLTCSVGVAPNKLLAKMASEFEKPNGVAVLYSDEVQARIWPLACRKINGIGPKAGEKLACHGVETIGDLAAQSLEWLVAHFGKSGGSWLHEAAWGRDDRPVHNRRDPVSMSRETTFERDLHAVRDRSELAAIFTQLCEQVAADLQRKGYVGRSIGIKLRYADFSTVTRDQSLPLPTQDAATIRHAAGLCLKRAPLDQRLRLLGVRVSALVPASEAAQSSAAPQSPPRQPNAQIDLFTAPLF